MQRILLPLVGAAVAGGTAWLVSSNLAVAMGAAIGMAIAAWIAQKRQAPPA
jgi:hypothetical protein